MTETDYHAPTALTDALQLLAASPSSRLLAGGSDLIVQMRNQQRSGQALPGCIVDLKHIDGLVGISAQPDGGWLIGAATPCAAIGAHAHLRRAWPGVVEAACLIGSMQVQGRASLGGNLCNASPAADSVPALIAAGATLLLAHSSGRRELPVQALAVGPGRTALAPGELVQAVRLPARPARSGDAYLRLIPRSEMDIAVVGAAVQLTLDEKQRVTTARVALGAVAPTARLVPAAAEALLGSLLDDAALQRLQAAARAACQPIDDKRGTVAYRTQVAGVLAGRAARIAYERACTGDSA